MARSYIVSHENARHFLFSDVARSRVVASALLPDQLRIWVDAWIGIGIQEGSAAEGLSELEIVEDVRIELLMLTIE